MRLLFDWNNVKCMEIYGIGYLRKYLQTAGAEIKNITYLDEQEIQFKVISHNILKISMIFMGLFYSPK